LEYNLKNSKFFRNAANSYEGSQLLGYIFIRISPTLMLIFSALNSGLDTIFENYIPKIFVQIIIGLFIGIAAAFLGHLIRSRYKILQNSTSQNS